MSKNCLNEKRICKVCRDDKELEYFPYHSTTGFFSRTCKECANKNRREKFAEKAKLEGRQLDINHLYHRSKICVQCGEEKDLNKDNFLKSVSKAYNKVCRKCHEENKVKNALEKATKFKFSKLTVHRYSIYRAEDYKKGRIFGLTKDFIEKCLSNGCTYCGFPATGLDRLDNSLEHTDDNCISCCMQCNHARNNYFTHEEMLEIGKIIRSIKLHRNANN